MKTGDKIDMGGLGIGIIVSVENNDRWIDIRLSDGRVVRNLIGWGGYPPLVQ